MTTRLYRTVITEDVETQLQETAVLCRRMNLPLRCLHLALSTLPNYSADMQAAVIDGIAKSIEDTDAVIYVARDRDVFVLSRLATRKTLFRLLRELPGELVPAPEQATGLAQLFELNIDSQRLEQICTNKMRAQAEVIYPEEPVKVAEPVPTPDIAHDLALHAHLIDSIAARRMERKTPSVLFVEDDVFSQRLLGNALRAEYDVQAAMTGHEGLMSYLKTAPDIVFLDINLPDMTGLEILQEIFRLDPRAFVVMLSGNGYKENVMKAIQGGARGFIGKPFTLEKLQQYLNLCPFILDKRHNRELVHA